MKNQKNILNDLAAQLESHPYWFVGTTEQPKLAIYETSSSLLWDANPDASSMHKLKSVNTAVEKIKLIGLKNWELPTTQELTVFARNKNPFKLDSSNRILGIYGWMAQIGCVDLDSFLQYESWAGRILARNTNIVEKTPSQRIEFFIEHGLQLRPSNDIDAKDLLENLTLNTASERTKPIEISARDLALQEMLSSLLNTTVGDYCNEYLRNISVMNARFNQLSELAALNSTTKSKK